MDPTQHPDYLAFQAALDRLQALHPIVRLDLQWDTTISIISSLQLSLRHPGHTGLSAQLVRQFVDGLIARIGTVEPRLAEVLRLGDRPECDIPVEG